MNRQLRVSADLRADDVPPGTRVTPRGREYTIMGLLGGWAVGGACMFLTWDVSAPIASSMKVLAAATGGSLLGTLISWSLPGTRARQRVIVEMKAHVEKEREVASRALQQAVGADARPLLSAPPRDGARAPACDPAGSPSSGELREREGGLDVVEGGAVPPSDVGEGAWASASAAPSGRESPDPRDDGSVSAAASTPPGDASALLDALGRYSGPPAGDSGPGAGAPRPH